MPPRDPFLCPETGKDLSDVNLRKYAEHLWPAKAVDNHDPRCDEARKRKAIVLAEADRRDLAARSAKA